MASSWDILLRKDKKGKKASKNNETGNKTEKQLFNLHFLDYFEASVAQKR